MMFINDESNAPEGWECLPLPDGRLLAVDPDDDEEYVKIANGYHHLLAGDSEEFWKIVKT